MHASTALAPLGSLATASVLPRQDSSLASFILESRLPNGTSMGYFSPTTGGGGWYGAFVDDISDATSLVLNSSRLVTRNYTEYGNLWTLGWIIPADYDVWQEMIGLVEEEYSSSWGTGFSIDADEENLLKYNGERAPLLFGGESFSPFPKLSHRKRVRLTRLLIILQPAGTLA